MQYPKSYFIVLFILLGISHFVFGQNTSSIALKGLNPDKSLSQYTLESWSSDNGLPVQTILQIFKSKNGYVWIATFDGLIRFDGLTFELFNQGNIPQFNVNGVLSVYEKEQGELMIGTNGAGVFYYDGKNFYNKKQDSLLANSFVTSIIQDNQGNIWIGTRSGLFRMIGDQVYAYPTESPLSRLRINSLYADDSGLWVSSNNLGLIKVEGDSYTIFENMQDGSTIGVRNVIRDSRNQLWVGANNGIYKLQGESFEKIAFEKSNTLGFVNVILEDLYGSIWFGTEGGLVRFANDEYQLMTESQGLSNNTIQSLMQDEEGSLWIGTYRGGINRLKDGKFQNYGTPEGLAGDIVNVVYRDRDLVWIGTESGLSRLSGRTVKNYTIGTDFSGNRVRAILRDKKGRLWIGTYGGLYTLENEQLKRFDFGSKYRQRDRIRVLAESPEGDLWIGTTSGLFVLSENGLQELQSDQQLPNSFIMSIFFTVKGDAWVGTNGGGVCIFNDKGMQIIGGNEQLSGNVVFQIFEDRESRIWIGTNNGFTLYEKGNFYPIRALDKMVWNAVFQVYEDLAENLWMFTGNGIFSAEKGAILEAKNDESKLRLVETRYYSREDGMRSGEITGASIPARDGLGRFWVPTIKGVTVIDPMRIPVNYFKPPVLIKNVFVDQMARELEPQFRIEAGTKRVEIEFTGLSFYAPEKQIFKYKLTGFDKDWVMAGNTRTATYTNLPPGEYSFEVMAANSDGIWNEEPAKTMIVQAAFFYQTIWFYLLLVSGFVFVAFIAYLLRTRNLRYMNQELKRLVEERTVDIQKQNSEINQQKEELKQLNALKDKMFSIVSHDLRSPLKSIDQLLKLIGADHMTIEEFKVLSKNLDEEVRQLLAFLENLLNWSKSQMEGMLIKPGTIYLKQLVSENMALYKLDAQRKQIKLVDNIPSDARCYADFNMINLVLRNIIGNAVKFTEKGGKIEVNFKIESEKRVAIIVKDTGIGISDQNLRKLFDIQRHYSQVGTSNELGTGLGLLLSKEFVEKNGGSIEVISQEKVGSEFRIYLPSN